MKFLFKVIFISMSSILAINIIYARSIFLNGIDVSSAKNQSLKNVDLEIDENGNIYINAPHYQIIEENSFIPLSKYYQNNKTHIEHKPLQPLPNNAPQILKDQNTEPSTKISEFSQLNDKNQSNKKDDTLLTQPSNLQLQNSSLSDNNLKSSLLEDKEGKKF